MRSCGTRELEQQGGGRVEEKWRSGAKVRRCIQYMIFYFLFFLIFYFSLLRLALEHRSCAVIIYEPLHAVGYCNLLYHFKTFFSPKLNVHKGIVISQL